MRTVQNRMPIIAAVKKEATKGRPTMWKRLILDFPDGHTEVVPSTPSPARRSLAVVREPEIGS